MPLTFNIRDLEHASLRLKGGLATAELGLDQIDEMILAGEQLKHDFEVERHERSLFIHGNMELLLHCECVRCLKRFEKVLNLPNWACLLPLDGEEKVLIVNDCVDLTPYVREDIVLALPQHPLCEPECCGLVVARQPNEKRSSAGGPTAETASAWAKLDKLKL